MHNLRHTHSRANKLADHVLRWRTAIGPSQAFLGAPLEVALSPCASLSGHLSHSQSELRLCRSLGRPSPHSAESATKHALQTHGRLVTPNLWVIRRGTCGAGGVLPGQPSAQTARQHQRCDRGKRPEHPGSCCWGSNNHTSGVSLSPRATDGTCTIGHERCRRWVDIGTALVS